MASRPSSSLQDPVDKRGERTRKLIKATIAKLAAQRDIADINLADICRAAKLTTGALYFHFGGKDEAVEEMVIDQITDLYGSLASKQTEGFEALVKVVLEGSTRYHRAQGRLPRAIQVFINTRPRVYAAWIKAREPLAARFEAAITRERGERGLATEHSAYLAYVILNSIEDLAMDVFQWSDPTLKPFAQNDEDWNERQVRVWTWAILVPIPAET